MMKRIRNWWKSPVRNYDLQLAGLVVFGLVLWVGCMLVK